MRVCEGICCVCVCVVWECTLDRFYIWRSEDTLECQPYSAVLTEKGSSNCSTIWSRNLRKLFCLCIPFCHRSTETADLHYLSPCPWLLSDSNLKPSCSYHECCTHPPSSLALTLPFLIPHPIEPKESKNCTDVNRHFYSFYIIWLILILISLL